MTSKEGSFGSGKKKQGSAHARFNIAIVDIMIHQAGYIAGFVAASQEGVKRIGYVGSNYVSFAYKNENSFALGALAANPNITLLITHIGSWFNPRLNLGKHIFLARGDHPHF